MDKVIAAYKLMAEYELQVKELNQKIADKGALLTEAFVPLLAKAYKRWEPKLGEPMMIVDFLQSICFQVTLESIDGRNGRARENERSFYRFDLDPDIGEYSALVFVIPMFFYDEIKDSFNLERWDNN